MDDAELVHAVEACTLPVAEFRHRTHVRLAWCYLRAAPFGLAGERFCTTLRRYAEAHGKGAIYHETITWAYLALVNERRLDAAGVDDFDAFAAANPDLLDHKTGALARAYDAETLGSERARRVFVLPRRG